MANLSSRSTLPTQVDKARIFCPEINRICFFTQIEPAIKNWLFKLQDNMRLNIALKAFKAIDEQIQMRADLRDVVEQLLREIKDDMRTSVTDVRETMDKSVKDYLQSARAPIHAHAKEEYYSPRVHRIHDSHDLLVFHESKSETLLRKLNILEKLNAGQVVCVVCGRAITKEDFGGLFRKENKIFLVCDDLECLEKVGKLSDAT